MRPYFEEYKYGLKCIIVWQAKVDKNWVLVILIMHLLIILIHLVILLFYFLISLICGISNISK